MNAHKELVKLLPDSVTRIDGDGSLHDVPISALQPGDRVIVRPGAKVPVDGEITEGSSGFNEAMLTGESRPITKGVGATAIGGGSYANAENFSSRNIGGGGSQEAGVSTGGGAPSIEKFLTRYAGDEPAALVVNHDRELEGQMKEVADKWAAEFQGIIALTAGVGPGFTAAVEWLRKARTLLNPGGAVLLSIPNVGHGSVVADLLAGRWDYTPAGIHCVTHVRFFTRTGILALVDEAGLQCEQVEAVVMPPPPWFAPADVAGELRCDRDSLASYAYHVRARLPGAAG